MRKLHSMIALVVILFTTQCKPDNYYYQQYLDDGENASLAMVDSAEIKPGNGRAVISFKVGIDARVEKVRISYGSITTNQRTTLDIPVVASDFGRMKDVAINNLTEAGFIADIRTFRNINGTQDSSKNVQVVSRVYGERYRAALANRIYTSRTTVAGQPTLNFQVETGLPQDRRIFTPMQAMEIVYTDTNNVEKVLVVSPYDNAVQIPDLAPSGSFRYRTMYKPTENAIDAFYTDYKTVNY